MSESVVELTGVLLTEPFPYQNFEEPEEVYLAKFQPSAPMQVGEQDVAELYLNFGRTPLNVQEGEGVTVTGELIERKMVTRSGKMRRGGIYQLLVQSLHR